VKYFQTVLALFVVGILACLAWDYLEFEHRFGSMCFNETVTRSSFVIDAIWTAAMPMLIFSIISAGVLRSTQWKTFKAIELFTLFSVAVLISGIIYWHNGLCTGYLPD
jgi:hypothetical protein